MSKSYAMTFYQKVRVLLTHVVADTIVVIFDETGNEFNRIEFMKKGEDTAGILIPQAVSDSIVLEEELHQMFDAAGFKPIGNGVYQSPFSLMMGGDEPKSSLFDGLRLRGDFRHEDDVAIADDNYDPDASDAEIAEFRAAFEAAQPAKEVIDTTFDAEEYKDFLNNIDYI
jgi:hypothetical protein